jgi:hypothetical protein
LLFFQPLNEFCISIFGDIRLHIIPRLHDIFMGAAIHVKKKFMSVRIFEEVIASVYSHEFASDPIQAASSPRQAKPYKMT